MSTESIVKKEQGLENYNIEFKNADEIYFPKNCVICGANTINQSKQTMYGSYSQTKDYKKDFVFNIPICSNCDSRINLKTGISNINGILLILSSMIGIIFSIVSYLLIYSIFLSISIVIVSIVFPYLNYRNKVNSKIKLKNHLQVKIDDNKDDIQLILTNKQYAMYLNKINTKNHIQNDKNTINNQG